MSSMVALFCKDIILHAMHVSWALACSGPFRVAVLTFGLACDLALALAMMEEAWPSNMWLGLGTYSDSVVSGVVGDDANRSQQYNKAWRRNRDAEGRQEVAHVNREGHVDSG